MSLESGKTAPYIKALQLNNEKYGSPMDFKSYESKEEKEIRELRTSLSYGVLGSAKELASAQGAKFVGAHKTNQGFLLTTRALAIEKNNESYERIYDKKSLEELNISENYGIETNQAHQAVYYPISAKDNPPYILVASIEKTKDKNGKEINISTVHLYPNKKKGAQKEIGLKPTKEDGPITTTLITRKISAILACPEGPVIDLSPMKILEEIQSDMSLRSEDLPTPESYFKMYLSALYCPGNVYKSERISGYLELVDRSISHPAKLRRIGANGSVSTRDKGYDMDVELNFALQKNAIGNPTAQDIVSGLSLKVSAGTFPKGMRQDMYTRASWDFPRN